MIAAGAIWRSATRSRSCRRGLGQSKNFDDDFSSDHDVHHRDMSRTCRRSRWAKARSWAAYQRRRDQARAQLRWSNAAMTRTSMASASGSRPEPKASVRSGVHGRTSRRRRGGSPRSYQEKARMAAGKTQEFYNSNPWSAGSSPCRRGCSRSVFQSAARSRKARQRR